MNYTSPEQREENASQLPYDDNVSSILNQIHYRIIRIGVENASQLSDEFMDKDILATIKHFGL